MTVADLDKLSPAFDWNRYIRLPQERPSSTRST